LKKILKVELMKKIIIFCISLVLIQQAQAQVKPTPYSPTTVVAKPLAYPLEASPNFMRTLTPIVPTQDATTLTINSSIDSILATTQYFDELHRPLQTVSKQASPLKKDMVAPVAFDEYNRQSTQYMPYVAPSDDGLFKPNRFKEDSAFYKSLYPNEQINYSQTIYDGSPFNNPTKTLAVGNEWGGAGRGPSFKTRANTAADSVVLFTINIINENDMPTKAAYYLAGTLLVQEVTDERGIRSLSYTDQLGHTILTKTQDATTPSTHHTGWLCTYMVYDEMGQLRIVIPPKAVQQLPTANWQLPTAALQGLCYSYFYDSRGRQIVKCIPGKGKSYVAYDLLDRPVMTQDPNLRLTNQWAYVLYDGQSRPIKSGVITSTLIKDTIQAQAARSAAYPTLGGTYTVMTETYYDDYNWIAATGAPLSSVLDVNQINSTNFITNYNTAPDYAQPIAQSARIRGAVTGTKTLQLGSNNYTYAVSFYDSYGRAIQSQQNGYGNITASTSTSTIQYSYKGTVLRSHSYHIKQGSNAQTHTVLTKYSYDHVGRIKSTTKNIDNLGDKIISQLDYSETGQLKTKTLSPTGGAGGGVLLTETFSYNIRGMLEGINAPYVTQASNTGKEYFGEILSYTNGFTTNQYNGGIAGVQWKNAGDSTARAYGYTYDNVGRLTQADFTQQNSGASLWTNDKVNYTVSNLSYDAGGNILSMSQRGLLGVGGNALIDSLAYTYAASTNVLQKVTDLSTAGGMLGDFKDSVTTANDYVYDANGNIVKDNNRRLFNANGSIGTVFNLLDKPDSMAVAGKSCTYYTYDASGATLSKRVRDYRNNTTKIYTYVGGFVYMNDSLQYAMFEEGRVRWKTSPTTVVFDYMLKDHAGNVRTVITDEVRTDDYPAATMDTTTAIKNKEDSIYAGLTLTRVQKPAGYPTADNFPIPNANNYVAKVQGNAGSQKVGPSITLKVMKGDKFDFYVSSYYQAATTTAPLISPLVDIVNGLASGVSGSSVLNTHGVTNTQLQTAFTPNVTSFLNTQPPYTSGSTIPLAYVNWVLFDEQFNLVSSTSSFERVSMAGVIEPHVRTGMPITQSGYLYIYVSNNTPNIPVYFDNLKVKHIRGALLETNEFYPYGLKMANISYRAASVLVNRYGYNGGNEYEDEGELNYSNTFYRKYDAQIGRFTGVDMLAENYANFSPYNFGLGNPVMFNDPSGAFNNNPVNPASFSTAASLLSYIQQNGISNFENEFNSWTFGGGGQVTGYAGGNNFQVSSSGNSVLFFWTGSINDGQGGMHTKDGTMTANLNTFVVGQTRMSVQNLWNHAMSWGESHRDATYNWFNGTEHYDAMWQHNYDGFLKRKNSGQALSQKGDRGSYTESLAAMQAQYGREQDARNFEMGFVGVLAAPFAVYALAEAGVVGLASNGYTAVNTYLTNASVQSAIAINTAKNVAVDAIGGAIVQYGPSSMAFSGGLYGLVQKGYGFTVTGSTISSIGKFLGGPIGIGIFPSGMPGLLTGNSIFK
jgi:RHS repeat-associated protein